MSQGFLEDSDQSAPLAALADINMVPMIDVMLVLLVICLVTAPWITHAVKVELPKASSSVNQVKPESIELSIDKNNEVYWNGQKLDAQTVEQRMQAAAAREPQPELHIHAERTTRYEAIAQVMSQASRAGLTRIGFVTEPGKP